MPTLLTTTADRPSVTARRLGLRLGVSLLLALGALFALGASAALADAGNPIAGTTQGDLVQNPDGTVTVYVRGEWNWLTHGSDCNTDRAAAGLAMIWNDPTETGYTVTNGVVSAQVGVAGKDGSWADPNPIDGMVHPADVGNVPEGLPGLPKQVFNDPEPQAAGQPHPTTTWRGGCGREPLSAGQFSGFPWGSWGHDKSNIGTDGNVHLGYSHVYRSLDTVPPSICVNFYDVHGGGSEKNANFQVPQENFIDVLANDDNSIEKNAFNVNGGSCVHFAHIRTSSTPSVTLGNPISDTARITSAVSDGTGAADGMVTFRAYKDPTNCTGTPEFTSGPIAVDLDAGSEVISAPFTPLTTGTYYWVATYHSTADPQAADVSTTCKEAAETSVVNEKPAEKPAGGTAGKKQKKTPPKECKLRKARARVFVFTRHQKIRLVIRYVAFTRAKVTTSYTLHGGKGNLFLGRATKEFHKKGVFRLRKRLTRGNIRKVRAAKEFTVKFQIPGTPNYCKRFFTRKLTVKRFIEGQLVWFQTGSVFGGD